jgi:hypothetical protein
MESDKSPKILARCDGVVLNALARKVKVKAATLIGCVREVHGLVLWGGARYPMK